MIGDENQALLVGEIAGILSWRLDVAIELDDNSGDYTGRILIQRPSGWWAVGVEKLDQVPEVTG